MLIVTAVVTIGWLVWLYSLMAEADTGLPDGLACSGRLGAAYDSCMRDSEIGGLGAWSFTLGLAVFGLTTLVRGRRAIRSFTIESVTTALPVLLSASLIVASAFVLWNGASGEYFDASLGAAWWLVGVVVATVGGLLAGSMWFTDAPTADPDVAPRPRRQIEQLIGVVLIILIGALVAVVVFFFMGGPAAFEQAGRIIEIGGATRS